MNACGGVCSLRLLSPSDGRRFVAAVLRSTELHATFVSPPETIEEFLKYVAPTQQEAYRYGVWTADGELAGVVNINAILRGAFQNGSLGFYAFIGHQGNGYMRAAAQQVIALGFGEHGLHRLEANVQPANSRCCRLLEGLGFRLEGVAERLLRVDGQWRDHCRYALTREEWTPPRSAL